MVLWGHTAKGCIRPAYSADEWQQIIVLCAFRCFYCAQLLDDNLTKDHLIPLFRGGCRCAGNLVCACLRCNSMKKQSTVYEFLKMKPALVETTGEFFTTVICLEAICSRDEDPLLREIRRMADRKAFPSAPNYREPERASIAWKAGR